MRFVHFNEKDSPETQDLLERFGLRGRSVLELSSLLAPVVPGFLIESSDVIGGKLKESLKGSDIQSAVRRVESMSDKLFGMSPEDTRKPLLFKIVLSPSIQILSHRSIHAVGLTDVTVQKFAQYCGEDFAYQEYRRLIEEICVRFLGKKKEAFEAARQTAGKSELAICKAYREQVAPDFPQDVYEQLNLCLGGIAEEYLGDEMNQDIEAGLLVQMMVYGNFGPNSFNGVVCSRDVVNGEAQLIGYCGRNEFDTPAERGLGLSELELEDLERLRSIAERLEQKYRDIRELKFVIEEGRVWLVDQKPVESKSAQAEIRMYLDLHAQGVLSQEDLIRAIPSKQLWDLLAPVIDPASTSGMDKVTGDQTGSPGSVVGRVCFSTAKLLQEYRHASQHDEDPNFILVAQHTNAEDVIALEMGCGVIASEGGYASHAPVVSRSLRKPCVLYSQVEYHDGYVMMGGHRVNEMDTISLDAASYTAPTIWFGAVLLVPPDSSRNGLEEIVGVLEGTNPSVQVTAIPNSLEEARMALRLGSSGVGMYRMDSMINEEHILDLFRTYLLLDDEDAREQAKKEFSEAFLGICLELFRLMDGKPLGIVLLEGPLVNFLPQDANVLRQFLESVHTKYPSTTVEHLQVRIEQLRNVNPVLGQRGSRIGITYPELYAALVAPLARAVCQHHQEQGKVDLSLCVPGVIGDSEMRFIRYGRSIESVVIKGVEQVMDGVAREMGLEQMPVRPPLGSVLDLPAATMMAGHLAKQSDFFLINLSTLTQTTNGMSIEDLNTFFPAFTQYDILRENPFEMIPTPVRTLVTSACHWGRVTRPDIRIGLAGPQMVDIANLRFALACGVHSIIVPTQSVPIVKLSLAQHALEGKN